MQATTSAAPVSAEPVPFLDLATIHAPLKQQILDDIAAAIDASAFTNGPAVQQFERSFAAWCGTSACVGVASGLDALRLSLIASGIGPGDEVIVPANTFVATVEAVRQAGALRVRAVVALPYYPRAPAAAAAAVGPRTRALLPVHLYGQMADVAALRELAGRHGLLIFEDACQAHGARRDGVVAGTAGQAGSFSFYPGKNLGAMGDAGALVTDDEQLAASARALREHGQRVKYHHELVGWTARLDALQALVLERKLPHLDAWTAQRRRAAAIYDEQLAGVGDLRRPPVAPGSEPVWHLYPVRTADPEALAATLAERRIATGRHYPEPVHRSAANADLGYAPGAFPVAEALAGELLSLPIFPGIGDAQLARVIDAVEAHFARG
jgi:dTDP-4-amino-4,6-dideoxygalactose transaminase